MIEMKLSAISYQLSEVLEIFRERRKRI